MRRSRQAAVVWGIFLLTITSWPSPPEIPMLGRLPDFDKLVHGSLYGVEAFFLYFAIAWPRRLPAGWNRVLALTVFLALFGALDEIHQLWIPGRSAEVGDALTDTGGGLLGAAGALAVSRRRARQSPLRYPQT